MPSSESERVTCPKCGKGYRWQPALVGKSVTCKQCGTEFQVPNKPGMGVLPQPADDGLYELAADPDDEPELPPAYEMPKSLPTQTPTASQDEPAVNPTHDPEQATTADRDEDSPSEPQVHLSEAAKAARREAQRVAAAESERQPKWWQQKWLIIAAALLLLFVIIYWAIYAFSEAMEDGLHNTMQQGQAAFCVASESTQPGNAT